MNLFSTKMKLSDLIDVNYNLIGVLARMGISLSFGEKTVEEACVNYDIDADTFILICNVYTYDDYSPAGSLMEESKVSDIVNYLHSSHSYYITTALVDLADRIEELIEPCEDKMKKVIWKFFSDYKTELERHFAYEENLLFPYVDELLEGKRNPDYSIHKFEESHSNIDEKLNDLKNIVMKYLPAECDNARRGQVLYYIYHLEDDLARHTNIEDNILVPIVHRVEKNLEKQK